VRAILEGQDNKIEEAIVQTRKKFQKQKGKEKDEIPVADYE